jgi:heterodisulfide reductase subunit C/nitrate reductase gamma subunit
MFLRIALYISLIVFGIGLVYKISNWFHYRVGVDAAGIPASVRVWAAVRGILHIVFSAKILTVLRVFLLDVVLQVRVLREDFLRWFMHMCIYGGFVLLLLMHALGDVITAQLFPNYFSTLNPFMFLRDLFGALVIAGLAVALFRRFVLKIPRLVTTPMDQYAIIIVALVMISGIVLEGTKIASYSAYKRMVEEYSGLVDEDEMRSLEAYWVEEFGVVSPAMKGPFDAETLEQGREFHEMSCVECHSRPRWAFTGYGVAKIIGPVARWIDRVNMPGVLRYVHILACLVGLAYLPFSKMFHVVASPVSLLANAVMEKGKSAPANVATRQAMELDACTHCGTCTLRCSVGVAYEEIPNVNILPSEKIASLKALAADQQLTERELRIIQEGIYLCTNCYRCTLVCPVGINLQDLWFSAREALLQRGYPEFLVLSPLSFYRGLMREDLVNGDYGRPLTRAREAILAECDLMKREDKAVSLTPADRGFQSGLSLSAQASTFSACFGCETCTTVCPVVGNYDNPREVLGLLPHQIMHACGLGVRDLAFGSNMLWDCITCYQCQEQCPQGVGVTDVLYELRNLAIKNVKENMAD